MTKIDIKAALEFIKDKRAKELLLRQSDRVFKAIMGLLVWYKSKNEKFPAMVTGSSGSSKSFITVELFKAILGEKQVKHIIPPSEGKYSEFIENQIGGREFEMIIIDEAHKLEIDIETIQPHKIGLTIGEVFVRYDQLIFISHAGLGKNSSEDARLFKIEYGTPTREEIIDVLINFEGYPKEKANWSAWHSPRNIHNAKSISEKFGTSLQNCVLPCGLLDQDLNVLRYYNESELKQANTIGSCSGKLCLDKKAIEQSERRLKGEGFLVVGKQSKREVTELGKDLIYTIEPEPEPEPKQETSAKKTVSKSNAKTAKQAPKKTGKAKDKTGKPAPKKTASKTAQTSAKSKGKKTSKTDTVKPDKTPSQLQAEIANQIVKPVDNLEMVGSMD